MRFLLPVLLCLDITAQNHAAKWYFGNQAGLDFVTNPPTTILNSAMSITVAQQFTEGCSSIADGAGNLLFYTDGMNIWNQSNAVMANGTGLLGSYSSSQAALIVKQPGNANIYFVFTTGSNNNNVVTDLRYSVVDMSLAAGMGSVTAKNILLYTPTTEKLCAVKHCNLEDIWVITHGKSTNSFYAHLVTASGINAAVSSSVGPVVSGGSMAGCMKASPTGEKLGVCSAYAAVPGQEYELYDFDAATGNVSNPIPLTNTVSLFFGGGYGCEFSADGTKFYATWAFQVFNSPVIYQWDLCAGSATAIAASLYIISSPQSISQLQRAPNGKIYGCREQQTSLVVIDNPNVAGAGCNYNAFGPSTAPYVSSYGLPNFVTWYVPSYTPITSTVTCQTASFSTASNASLTCGPSSYSPASFLWQFGDAASGASNTSTLANPAHLFSGAGTYTVQEILFNSCQAILDTLEHIVIIAPTQPIYYNSDTAVCNGQPVTLTFPGQITYTWSTGSNAASIAVTPSASTLYSVSATDANNCLNISMQTVTVLPLPTLSIAGNTVVCMGAATTLTAAGALSYTWSPGAFTSTILLSPQVSSSYTVSGTNATGCVSSNSLTVNVSICTGIHTFSHEAEVVLYPNPNHGEFFIGTGSACGLYRLVITNLLGMKVFERQLSDLSFPIRSDLKSGIYYYNILKEDQLIGAGHLAID